jgi:fucose permease
MRDGNTATAKRMDVAMAPAPGARLTRVPDGPAPDLHIARRATGAFFALLGISVATWAALVPLIKSRLALDDARLGTVLLAFGFGTIASTLVAAWLTKRLGSRRVLAVAGPLMAISLPLLARAPSPAALAVLLFTFGVFVGLAGVAANAQAIAVQAVAGRPLMSSFHAMFSVGGLAGAAGCSLLLRAGITIQTGAIGVAALLLALVATQRAGLVPDVEDAAVESARERRSRVPPIAVLAVGAMTFALYLSEGAVLDWGAVFFHEIRGRDVASAALGYAAFSIMMATGRLLGDRVVARLGPVLVIRVGSLLAAAGFVTMVLARGHVLGLFGCAMIGLGASNVVPTLISASARVSTLPTGTAVSTVVAMGTTGLIAGPALIGFMAQRTGLAIALGGLALLLAAVAAAANVTRMNRQLA